MNKALRGWDLKYLNLGFSNVGHRKSMNKDVEGFVTDGIGDVARSMSRVDVMYYVFGRNIFRCRCEIRTFG